MRTRTGLRAGFTAALLGTWIAPAARPQSLERYYEGPNAGDKLGFLSAVGDIDGDGADDYAIGAPEMLNSDGYLGVVTVYSGLTGAVLHTVNGNEFSSLMGTALCGVGDFDGDLVNDFAFGDPLYGFGGVDEGGVSVLSGATGQLLGWVNGAAGQRMGFQVAGVGDMTGDGQGEVAISALGGDIVTVGKLDPGAWGNMTVVWSWTGQTGGLFGYDLAAAGDVDDDGTPDVVVGEPWYDDVGPTHFHDQAGRALVYSGATGNLIWQWLGDGDFDHLGFGVDGVGDVDGDGNADVIVGAWQDDTNGTDAGQVTVYSGQTGVKLYSIEGGAGTLFGGQVAGVGDMNGDGVGDFAAAALEYNNVGRVTTYSGANGTPFHDYDHAQGEFWGFVDGGDFDGDGDGDLVMGTPAWIDQNYFNGRVEIYCTSRGAWSNYGTGWPGTLGVPAIVGGAGPLIGMGIDVFVGNSLGVATPALLVLGFDDASIPTSKGGTILVDIFLTIPFTVPAAGETFVSTLPDDPALCDFEFFLQAIEVDPGASKGLSFTDGLKAHVGYWYP